VAARSGDTRGAVGLAIAVVLVIAAVIATPPPGDPTAPGFNGLPRLVLYFLAAAALAATTSGVRPSNLASEPGDKLDPSFASGRLVACLGLALTIAVVNALRLERDATAQGSVALWLVSIALVLVAVIPIARRPRLRLRVEPARASTWAVGAIVLVAVLARFVALDRVPGNVQADEGDRAASAIDVIDGVAPGGTFESGWFYVSMVYFRVLALFFEAFGVGVTQGRLLNAVSGVVLFGAVAWIGFRHFSRRVAFVALALAAVSPIALQFSRTIAESGVCAALLAVSLAASLEGGRTGRAWPFAVAGLAGGLSFYTYASARAWPFAAAGTFLVLCLTQRRRPRPVLRGAAVATAAALVAVLPWITHIRGHPDELRLRFDQTSVLSGENREQLLFAGDNMALAEVMVVQAERSLGVFDRYPDGIDFLPTGRPLFPRPLAALTLLGALYATLRSPRDPRLAILALWFWLGLLGMVLTVETPAVQRAAMLVVTLPILAAVVTWEMASRTAAIASAMRFRWADRSNASVSSPTRPRPATAVVVSLFVAGLMLAQGWSYFHDHGEMSAPWRSPTLEGRQVAQLGRRGPVYSLESSQHMVKSGWVRFLARGVDTGSIADPATQLPLIAADEPLEGIGPRLALPLPKSAEMMSFVLYGPAQLAYASLLNELYGVGRPTRFENGRAVLAVPPSAPGRQMGIAVSAGSRRIGIVRRVGDVPASVPLPARLRWTTGIRIAHPGIHRIALTAPSGYAVLLDGVPVTSVSATSRSSVANVWVPAGLHLLEANGRASAHTNRVSLRLSGELEQPAAPAILKPLNLQQTYPRLRTPVGLLETVDSGDRPWRDDAWPALATTIANGFVDTTAPLPTSGRVVWRGRLVAPRSGTYRLTLASDGAPTLKIDGRAVPDASANSAPARGVYLTAGTHRVRVVLPISLVQPTYVRWMWILPRRDGSIDATGAWQIVSPWSLRPPNTIRVLSTE